MSSTNQSRTERRSINLLIALVMWWTIFTLNSTCASLIASSPSSPFTAIEKHRNLSSHGYALQHLVLIIIITLLLFKKNFNIYFLIN